MKRVLASVLLSSVFAACTPSGPTADSPSNSPKPASETSTATCVVAGCSRELCLSKDAAKDLMSTCQWKDEYRCAQMMTCETQADGKCGFTPNEKSETCMKELPTSPAAL